METSQSCAAVRQADLDQIIEDLDVEVCVLPREAIRAAQQHREAIAPKLIEVIRTATQRARDGDIPKLQAHFFALFLLTEFQSPGAWPAIKEAMSLPDDLPMKLFDDAVHHVLPRSLLSLVDRPLDVVDEMAGDPRLNFYVRLAAAQAYVYLWRDGRLGRDEAVKRMCQLLKEAIEEQHVSMITLLVAELAPLGAPEALDDIRRAFDANLVETFFVGWEDVEEGMADGEAGAQRVLDRLRPTRVSDTIEELQIWSCFQQRPPRDPPRPAPPPRPAIPPSTARGDVSALGMKEHVPKLKAAKPVGRNDPCPCGSGKKFKKCCG